MTIQEAIKSGKKFKRPGYHWMEVGPAEVIINVNLPACGNKLATFSSRELLATDWVIEHTEPKKTDLQLIADQLEEIAKKVGKLSAEKNTDGK